jgi:asparagine synthase (glutamine-hydrolysing)
MCGICGKINYGKQPIAKELINKMCRSFSYRGPDDNGTYIKNGTYGNNTQVQVGFGHQRLSIIDLSKAGRQPMCNENGTVWITFNGEIYNFRELRKELKTKGHTFSSNSDTEVIIHLYEEEGINAVNRLNGMFAFGLWDQNLNRLWIGRDRIGIKPLLYYWDGKHFVFASEIKALLCDPSISKELDYEALYLYLAFNYVPAPYTIFKGIRKLKPGHYLILENGTLQIKKYWEAPQTFDSEIASLPFSEQETVYKQQLYGVLDDAVGARMIADVPLGAFLSGGIDSSIIVSLMARNSASAIRTFSIGFTNDKLFDETHYARMVADFYNTDHYEFMLDYKDMLEILSTVLTTFDEPFADSSAIPTFVVSRETKKHVKIALSGDGGDELFAGYRSYQGEYWYEKYMMIPALFRTALFEKLINALPDSRDSRLMEYIRRVKKFIKSTRGSFSERLLALKEVFPENIRRNILPNLRQNKNISLKDPALKWVEALLDFYQGDRINNILYSDLKDSLPGDMLTRVDLMSMKNSLEVRVPFLDHRVVELAFQMQGSLKLYQGNTKYILKETFKDFLPTPLLRRPKAGFEIPISRWLKSDLKFLVDENLSEDKIRRQGIFDYNIVNHLVASHLDNKADTSWMIWNLIVFQYWYNNYFI